MRTWWWIRMFFLGRWLHRYGLQLVVLAGGGGIIWGTAAGKATLAEVVILVGGTTLMSWMARWYQLECEKLEKQRDEYAGIVQRYARLLTDELRRPVS